MRLYQTGSKFRAEMKPRFGLIRSNEFIMKDLYTFDKDCEAALQTYQEVIVTKYITVGPIKLWNRKTN